MQIHDKKAQIFPEISAVNSREKKLHNKQIQPGHSHCSLCPVVVMTTGSYPELGLHRALGQHALDDVGAVQTVHAVAPKDPFLVQQHLPICIHQEISESTHTHTTLPLTQSTAIPSCLEYLYLGSCATQKTH